MAPNEDAASFTSQCELCREKALDMSWIEVWPAGEGISCVTVDVICPAHRARILPARGRVDSERIEPPRQVQGW